MRSSLRSFQARPKRLVDTSYIKSAFTPISQQIQLAYPGRTPDDERILDPAERRFEQSLAMQVLSAPMEKDIISGLRMPRSLVLPLTFMPITRKLELPAAWAAQKAMEEEEARAAAEAARIQEEGTKEVFDLNGVGPSELRGMKDQYTDSDAKNKRARKAKAAAEAAALALQGPSTPWEPPKPIDSGRARRVKRLPTGERQFLTDPIETRRLREGRARKGVLKAIIAAREARAWTVWYRAQIRPELSFATKPPRTEVDQWPTVRHENIYLPHTQRDFIFLHPAFVRAMGDTSMTAAGKMLSLNIAPGQEASGREEFRPTKSEHGMLVQRVIRWTRGTPLGPTQPMLGDADPAFDRPLHYPVSQTAEEASESAIRERIGIHVPTNIADIAHASLQAEVLAAAGWTPEQVLALFPILRPVDLDATMSDKTSEGDKQDESGGPQELRTETKEDKEEHAIPHPRDDLAGSNLDVAAEAGFTAEQLTEVQALLDTDSLIKEAGGLVPGDGVPPPVLAAIIQRASAIVDLAARHSSTSSTTATHPNPIVLHSLPLATSVAVHLWRLIVWRHQPYAATDLLRSI